MTLTNVRASVGLSGRAAFTRAGLSGDTVIGEENRKVTLTGVNVGAVTPVIFAKNAAELVLDLATNDSTGSTAWVAGAAQQETATAAGTVTAAGNIAVTVTAAGMTGSPKTIQVAAALNDVAATWAGKVRAALAADAAVAAMFTVIGTGTAIGLARKPLATFTVGSETVNIYAANDGTLNIALDNGTTTGVTPAASSANTTLGVETEGVKVFYEGEDFEGASLPTIATMKGVMMEAETGNLAYDINTGAEVGVLRAGAVREFLNGLDDFVESASFVANGPAKLTLTFFGATA